MQNMLLCSILQYCPLWQCKAAANWVQHHLCLFWYINKDCCKVSKTKLLLLYNEVLLSLMYWWAAFKSFNNSIYQSGQILCTGPFRPLDERCWDRIRELAKNKRELINAAHLEDCFHRSYRNFWSPSCRCWQIRMKKKKKKSCLTAVTANDALAGEVTFVTSAPCACFAAQDFWKKTKKIKPDPEDERGLPSCALIFCIPCENSRAQSARREVHVF